MAKAPKFKYTVTVEVTATTEIKAKELKDAVQSELLGYFDSIDGIKIGKVAAAVATK